MTLLTYKKLALQELKATLSQQTATTFSDKGQDSVEGQERYVFQII